MSEYVQFFPPSMQQQVQAGQSEFFEWISSAGVAHRIHYRACERLSGCMVVFIHGAGGHADALWPYAGILASRGISVAALDLPQYGLSLSQSAITYDDWVDCVRACVRHLNRPVVLVGLSLGGILAAEASTTCPEVTHVVATCLAQASSTASQAYMTRFGVLGLATPLVVPLAKTPLGRVRIPMRLVARFSRMSNHRRLSRMCARDELSGGAKVSLRFLASLMSYRHLDAFSTQAPVTLAHPGVDGWTPLRLSTSSLAQFHATTCYRELPACGHFPVEEPGVSVFLDIIEKLCAPKH